MSKKKAERKYRKQVETTLRSRMDEAQESAEDFFEGASPFEISVSLARLGVSTSHQAGAEAILSQAWANTSSDPTTSRVDRLLRSLIEKWRSEIQAKGRECEIEDQVFLVAAAQHSISVWSAKLEAQQANSAQES